MFKLISILAPKGCGLYALVLMLPTLMHPNWEEDCEDKKSLLVTGTIKIPNNSHREKHGITGSELDGS